MGSEVPKQFIAVNGVPILVHTIRAFLKADSETNMVLVLPKDQHSRWEEISKVYHLDDVKIVTGGKERFDSVKKGIEILEGESGVVAIHDAVRPCIDPNIILRSFETAEKEGSAVVCVPSKDSLRKVSAYGSEAVTRSDYYLVQTPQVFDLGLLTAAYMQPYSKSFTDDASVVEKHGKEIVIVEGDYKNIKVTTPEDLLVAEIYISQ
jgi:2-C-methyl-D-erythritol 4-phosphate cytidylyltransferase